MNPLSLSAWVAAALLASTLFAHTVALRLILLLAGLGLLAAAIAKDRRSLQLLPPLWLPLVAWGLWALASLAWSIDVERTGKELRNEIGYSMVAYWLCFVAAQARDATRIFLPVIGVACLVLCANAIYLASPVADGWFGGPGNLSSALLALMPCAVAAAWYGQRTGWQTAVRAAPVALVVVILVAAYTAQSRTFWLALAAQVGCVALLLALPGEAAAPKRRVLAFATVALALAAAAFTLHVQTTREAMGARTLEEDPRLALWREVAERIQERPWTGYGFGRGMLRVDLRGELNDVQLWHAHNLFLDTALQLGLPGALLLLAVLAATLREAWRLARDPSPLAMACGMAAIAVVAGTLIRNMTDVLLVRQNALLYWGVLGVLFAFGARTRRAAP